MSSDPSPGGEGGSSMIPERYLKLGCALCQLAFAGTIVLASRPCLGDQIVAVKDRNGNIVYVNIGTPASPVSISSRPFFAPHDTPQTKEIDSVVNQVAGRDQVDPRLVKSIISVESDYDPQAVSPKGAMGLMQLMPGTAADLGVTNPFDIRQNIQGGVSHLKYLLNLFNGDVPLSLAAYNAGEHTVEESHGIPAIPETQSYVRKVTRLYRPGKLLPAGRAVRKSPAPAPIFEYVDSHGVIHFSNTQ